MIGNKQSSTQSPLFVAFIVFYFVFLPATAIAQQSKSEKVILQIKWIHQFNFAGYYAAVEKGYYKEAGLEVTIKEGQPGMDFIDEVISGRANFGVEMPELLIARNNGKPVIVIAAIFQHSPQIILARADSGIKSPHNLIDKKVMWRFDSAAELRAMLINEKVSLEQIGFMELSWNINDLIGGNVDAIHAYVTDQPFILEKAGIESAILYPINYGIDFYGDCLFTSEKEISENPDGVRGFREASLRGWAYAMNNPEEIMDIIRDKYGTKSTREFMRNEFEHINRLMLPQLVEIGHINPGRWKHIGDTFVKLGMIDPDYSLDGFLYDPNPQTDYVKVMRIIWILLSVVALISISAIILLLYNRKLNRKVRERTKHLSAEIADRKQAQAAIALDEERLESLLVLHEKRVLSEKELFNYALEEAVRLTKSKCGYLHFVDDNENSISLNTWSKETLKICKAEKTPHYPLASAGIWADCVRLRKPVIHNDYPNYPDKKGFPEGHFPILRHMSVPVFDAEKIVAIIGVGNKEEPYDDADQRQLHLFFVSTWDIIKQKKYEKDKRKIYEQLQQSQKTEAIGTLAGGIAHDFNNILAAILGFADMAQEDIPNWSPAKLQIKEVLNAGNRAKDLVKQILAFSRNSGQSREPVNIQLLISETLNFLRASIPTTIEIRVNSDSQSSRILADPTQIHQVLMNLCTNAAYAMEEEGGVLSLDLREVQSTDEHLGSNPDREPGSYILLSVTDTGVGISKEIIERIFDPYFTTKAVGKGSGMGLAVVHGIVHSHGGLATVESTLGQGTTFKLYFPKIESEDDVQDKNEDADPLPVGNERIIVVDDEDSIVRLTQSRLESLGYQVTARTSSSEVLDLFRSNPNAYDLVITDQTMPRMTGEQLAKELIKIQPSISIVMCTGYSSRIDADKASSIGIRAFIMKPVDREKLAKIVRKVLDGSRMQAVD
jgi:signal transduction histidine kinase/ABC-type nitrate/sulfonate/bicarbonate transport system substrate-binding protein/ActR/RegA family two-component response regulator